jgi:6-phosphogluconolactonase (cycloisomerase 2 family)
MTLDPQGRYLYVGSSSGRAIYAFQIDSASGALTAAGEPLPVGDAPDFTPPAFIATDPSGQFVYVTQSFTQGLRGYRIDPSTGALVELAGSPFATSGLPAGDNVIGGGIVFKPTGDFLYTSGGGLNAFSIDPTNGALTLLPGSPFTLDVQSDASAPNIAMDPAGEYLYVTRFLLTNHISGFAINEATGALTPVPNSPLDGDAPYSIAVEPSGRFVFIGDDLPTTSVYSLTRSTGALTELAHSPFAFGGLEPKFAFATLP